MTRDKSYVSCHTEKNFKWISQDWQNELLLFYPRKCCSQHFTTHKYPCVLAVYKEYRYIQWQVEILQLWTQLTARLYTQESPTYILILVNTFLVLCKCEAFIETKAKGLERQ